MLAPSAPASGSGNRPANPATGSKPSANSLTTEARFTQRISTQSVAISASVPHQSVPVSPSIAAVKSISIPSASSASVPQSKSQAAPDLSPLAKSALHELHAVKADLDQPVPAPVIPVLASGQEAPAQERSTRFPPLSSRSTEFWCWDGNVIVKVEDTYFRLFMSRLERHCGLFKRVFAERSWVIVTGQKVVGVPNLKVQDFETFLKYLEIPMENSVKDASKDTAMSLLRASRVVSCRVLAKLAEQRLLGPWASADIPSPEDGLDGRPYREAIEMLGLSRELNAPLAQKQALYSLLANEQFWSDVASQRAEVDLSDTDILLLYRARATIQEKWRILALTPPSEPCLLDVCLRDESARNALWWGQTAKYTKTEVRDPLRSAVNVKTAIPEMGHWCRACLEERVRAWDNARNLWWSDLDQLLGIAVPEGHA
ncbi:hypothetical protein L226DRAFT_386814 [Lentinus tigrinus ALCF2SS1-7]|uniref:BTB domain-containing protein n=1 Tax=Lentinus tigrinus ALCF2SS1-6 TaxID=1328759 RepID=A0A5C2S9U4_9APHY|nr:hypothetical protein L227DRAFT_88258 [Lentinus tigrinus ALCF2SS1-6]RPD75732.1 hypothetical protein L226DRAFT_386814 [Lentinus tigrinus ALCF2SS1-7]